MRDRYLDRAHFGSNNPDNKRRNELKQFGNVSLNLTDEFAYILVDGKKSRTLQGHSWNPLPTRVLLYLRFASTENTTEILFLIFLTGHSFYTN